MNITFIGALNAQVEDIQSLKSKLNNKIDTIQAGILLEIGDEYLYRSKYDSALSFYFAALNIAESIPDNNYRISILREIAELYALQGKSEIALSFGFKALKLAEEQKDDYKIVGIQLQIGLIYLNNGQYEESLKYALKNLGFLNEETEGKISGSVFMRLADIYKSQEKYDSAIFYEMKAIEIVKAMGNDTYLAMCLNNLGIIYLSQGNHNDALKYFLEALSLIEVEDSLEIKGTLLLNISGQYFAAAKLDLALSYANQALEYFKAVGDKEGQKRVYFHIANLYNAKRDYKEAFNYLLEYTQLYDSLNTSESQNKLLELQSRYEVDTKEKQIEILKKTARLNAVMRNVFIIGSILLVVIILLIVRQYRIKRRSEAQINQKNITLSKTLDDLKATQAQLIQSEKMASLGELTAGIAHEIQNPLNFVNNFSEVSNELVCEMMDEAGKGNTEEVKAIAKDIQQNLEKIGHHGKRADAIVKGMLQHSRISTGHKEPTDINALCDEYLRLAYHGLKAKDQAFKASFHFEADNTLPKANIVPQDIGRVLLNLINNAFQACGNDEFRMMNAELEPHVEVSTKNFDDKIEIRVKDNGPGIPQKILDKIFQPFFTTKPAGQGTGLGLSLSYDIVKAHGGELKVETVEGEGSDFVIVLPNV